MLLEYFRPEPFRVLARWQSLHNGKVPELAALEAVRSAASMPPGEDGRTPKTGHSGPIARGSEGASATPARRKSTPASRKVLEAVDAPEGPSGPLPAEDEAADELPTESQSWIGDEWLRAWLDTEPQLGNEDLGAYFYFARDRLTQRGIVTQRLSPLAQRLFGELLSESKAVRDAAATQAKDMMSPDAVALQEALAENVRISDDLEDARSPLLGLFARVSARQDLAMDLISLLRSLPVSSFRAGTPGRLLAAIGSSPEEPPHGNSLRSGRHRQRTQPCRQPRAKRCRGSGKRWAPLHHIKGRQGVIRCSRLGRSHLPGAGERR